MIAEQLTPPITQHGEGPVWSPSWGGLSFVDMLNGDIVRLSATGAVERWSVSHVAAALRPRKGGGLVAATESSFVLFEEWGSDRGQEVKAIVSPGSRFNDGSCDPSGNFLCGSMADAARPGAGTLYCLSPDLKVSIALGDVTASNGLGFSPAGDRAYYIDSATRRVDTLDWSAGRGLHNRQPFIYIDPDKGRPDGLCVDANGGIWVALWGGGAVRRYDALGRLDEIIEIPVAHVTACTFGGASLDELYITTSRLGPEPEPAAGALFRSSPGIEGLPSLEFNG